MTRELTDHKVNGLNEALRIEVLDEPGPGNACHSYVIYVDESKHPNSKTVHLTIGFQKGPILESGINGVSQEALLTVVLDRLRGFQAGEFKCRENARALTHIEEALMWLQKRTNDRMKRGVEGTNVK